MEQQPGARGFVAFGVLSRGRRCGMERPGAQEKLVSLASFQTGTLAGQGSRVSAALSWTLGAETRDACRPFKQSSEASRTSKRARVSEASKICCAALAFVRLQNFGGWGARAAVSRGGAPPAPRAGKRRTNTWRGAGGGGQRNPRSHPEPACGRRVRRGCERSHCEGASEVAEDVLKLLSRAN